MKPGRPSPIRTSASGCSYGSGFSRTPYTAVKIAVLAPIPSASVSTAAMVNPGFAASVRKAYRMSFSIGPLQRRDNQRRVVLIRGAVEGFDVLEHRGEHLLGAERAVLCGGRGDPF